MKSVACLLTTRSNGLHIVISFCLGLSFVGLWLHQGWGLIISSLAWVSILMTYGYWHLVTVKYLNELRNNHGHNR